MKIANHSDIQQLAMKQVGLPSVYVNNGLEFNAEEDEIWKTICTKVEELFADKPKFSGKSKEYFDTVSELIDGGIFFFDTMEEAKKFYDIFNSVPVYSSAVYATLNDETGTCLDENT